MIQLGDATRPQWTKWKALQRSVSAAGSLAALNLVVQAARDLPGRKTVILASEGFPLSGEIDGRTLSNLDPLAAPASIRRRGRADRGTTISGAEPRVRSGFDRVIDQATRSGVVIYAIDGQALQTGGLRAADDIHSADPRGNSDAMGASLRGFAADRLRANRDAQESLAYLAEQTGGFAVMNTNDLAARPQPDQQRRAGLLRDRLRAGSGHLRAAWKDAAAPQDRP